MITRSRTGIWVPALAGLLVASALVAPGVASAVTHRYAEPNGNGAEPCAQSDPCSIESAVTGAAPGAFVFLEAGTYNLDSTLAVGPGVWVQGIGGDPSDVILSSAVADAVKLNGANAVLEIATISHTSSGTGTALGIYGGTADRVIVKSTGIFTCDLNGGLIRDSYCLNTYGGNGTALSNAAVSGTGIAEAVNVTAVATGSESIAVWAAANGVNATLNAHNVIAASPNFDEGSVANGATATVAMDHSNFGTYEGLGGGTNNLTVPGSGSNQMDPPLLAGASSGDPHELEGSPTIDAGDNSAPSSGSFALFGGERIHDGTADIGADEFDTPPTVSIDTKPKSKTRSRTARFAFSADENVDFACKVDHKPFRPCGSPKTYRGLKRGKKHQFKVRGTDSGQQTGTATYSWKVLKRNR
jgi:hypothetical protein